VHQVARTSIGCKTKTRSMNYAHCQCSCCATCRHLRRQPNGLCCKIAPVFAAHSGIVGQQSFSKKRGVLNASYPTKSGIALKRSPILKPKLTLMPPVRCAAQLSAVTPGQD